ncbi:MAG: hypothetical protein AAFP22_01135, partial [Planctomycetota bacterium]
MEELSHEYFEADGRAYTRITGYDRIPPFLVTVVSSSDCWMFLSSLGPLTAGRGGPPNALFPYTTEDKIHDAVPHTGPCAWLQVGDARWHPFDARGRERYRLERRFSMSTAHDAATFEELNHDLGLAFRATWEASERHGWVRTVELERIGGGAPLDVSIVDGFRNLMPADAHPGLQNGSSVLLDAYRSTERVGDLPLAVLRLSSIPIDQPRPNESLRANVVYTLGLTGARTLLDASRVDAFLAGDDVPSAARARGQRGAYFAAFRGSVGSEAPLRWRHLLDVEKDGADVVGIAEGLAEPAALWADIDADLARSRDELDAIVGSVDGLQRTSDPAEDARHRSNALFNAMRGGVFARGYRIAGAEFADHVAAVAPALRSECAAALEALPTELDRSALLERCQGSLALKRIAEEYLPLTFSRRHGDPSRPWNTFRIPGRRPDGAREIGYEGNWRDIFQNWEALTVSYPHFAPAAVARFLNASTADGYNPYRITLGGVDWEVHDPDDPWSFIGYWGDHQVVYLARLVELAERHVPGSIAGRLDADGHVFVDVPYRIAGFDRTLEDPRSTVDFDEARAAEIDARVARFGNEGRMLSGPDGAPVTATLGEKLLTPLLVKLTNLVPGGGVWMNTQRPEWNDANNAIAGWGLSVVTTAHLHGALASWTELFERGPDAVALTGPVADLFDALSETLASGPPEDPSPAERRRVVERLGRAGERHRTAVYAGASADGRRRVSRADVVALLRAARRWTQRTLEENRRDDGLFHAYNLLRLEADGGLALRRLALMLEGQVAVLGSGLLDGEDALALLRALRGSALWRDDRSTYLLYPNRQLDAFLERGALPDDAHDRASVRALLGAGGAGVLRAAPDGSVRFAPGIRNAGCLDDALAGVPDEVLDASARADVRAL